MSDEWNCYFCRVNGAQASISVDLGLRENAPDAHRPHLLWVWVYLKIRRPDGFSDSAEFDRLVSIEEQLATSLKQACDAIFCGRITTAGRREFYFYGASSANFTPTVENAMANFPNYVFDSGSQMEPDWNQYLNLLYPSEENRQSMENGSVLAVLIGKGDTLNTPRDVFHSIYFGNENDREEFWTAIMPLGYKIESRSRRPGTEFPFGLCIVRVQSVKPTDIDEAVLELFRQAKEFRGDYDGWEAKVLSQ